MVRASGGPCCCGAATRTWRATQWPRRSPRPCSVGRPSAPRRRGSGGGASGSRPPTRRAAGDSDELWRWTMTDLDTQLRTADRITAPDLWSDIVGRSPGPEPGHGPGPGRRVAAAAVALAVATAGGYLVVRSFGGSSREAPAPPEPAAQADGRPSVELAVTDVV